jgi:glutamate--cysteine ligase
MADEATVDAVVEVTAPVADLWFESAREGLAHPAIAVAAQRVLALGCDALDSIGVPASSSAQIFTDLAHKRAALAPSKR